MLIHAPFIPPIFAHDCLDLGYSSRRKWGDVQRTGGHKIIRPNLRYALPLAEVSEHAARFHVYRL